MTTTELIKALRDLADECEDMKRSDLLDTAADMIEWQDETIERYHRADVFLITHGWKWV